MPLDPENATHLKPWLVKTLEPICDAEPGALADYILALLKHSAPETELRKELMSQLEEFLEKECSPFIDTLFTALRTKSYLPYVSDPPPSSTTTSPSTNADGGIPIPLDALLTPLESTSPDRGRKRGFDYDDDSRPSKGPRLNDDQFGRYGRQQQGWDRGERGSRMGLTGRADFMDGGMNGAMQQQQNARAPYPPNQRRGICRDYHNNGYCSRGAFCKYSHGDDAVIPAQLFPINGMPGGQVPFMPMMNGNMPYGMPGAPPNVAYDPHERILLPGGSMGVGTGRPQQQRAPLLPRHGEAGSAMSRKPGELPHIQDLTPEIPPEERLQQQQQQQQNVQGGEGYGMANPSMNPPDSMMPMPMTGDVDMAGPSMPSQRGGFRGHRGGGRGTFGGDAASFRPQKRNDKTLVVEKIPEEKLSLGSVNDWFKKFGTVTNVAVDAVGGKALVSFSTHDEAHAAWKSEDAVFGNRFVKVFWHRPKEGHGHMGTRMLAASAPLVANFSKDPSESAPVASSGPSTSSTVPATSVRKHSTPSAASALAAKQHLLEQQIAEQKALMAKLGTASPEEKKDIMIRLRKLNEEMKAPTPSVPSKSQSPGPATPSAQTKSSRDSTPRIDESKKKELLDKELELHNAVNGTGESEESTEELQAKLARLKAEAASMGLADSTASESSHHAPSGYRGGYRGRGRGARSYYRGAMRGGPPRGSMKLDNRPKKLLVKGVNEAQVQAVRDWYETTGQLDTLETIDGGDLVVSFKSRPAAEQGLFKGSSIATVGPVQISWYTSQHTNGTTIPKTPAPGPIEPSTSTTSKSSETESITHVSEPLDDIPMQPSQEEEVGARGWGDDDGFGML